MELPAISALRPKGTDASSIVAAIAAAETARASALEVAHGLERDMKAMLLTATNTQLEKAERDANNARRDVDRIAVLLDQLRSDLVEAEALESADGKRALANEAHSLDALFVQEWRKSFDALAEGAARIVKASEAADAAIQKAANARALDGDRLPRRALFEATKRMNEKSNALEGLAHWAPSVRAAAIAAAEAQDARDKARRRAEAEARAARAAAYRAEYPEAESPPPPQHRVTITPDPLAEAINNPWSY